MSEGTAQRRIGLAQGPGFSAARRPQLGRRTEVLQLPKYKANESRSILN